MKSILDKNCTQCNLLFKPSKGSKGIFCSHRCYSDSKIGKVVYIGGHTGKKHSEEWKNYMSKILTGREYTQLQGKNHHNWIKDRSLVKRRQERNNPEYKQWRKKVWERDKFLCKMLNSDCLGKIEAHHILGWSNYPELRYEVNNGITLCHAHHPRKEDDVAKLSPFFKKMLAEMK